MPHNRVNRLDRLCTQYTYMLKFVSTRRNAAKIKVQHDAQVSSRQSFVAYWRNAPIKALWSWCVKLVGRLLYHSFKVDNFSVEIPSRFWWEECPEIAQLDFQDLVSVSFHLSENLIKNDFQAYFKLFANVSFVNSALWECLRVCSRERIIFCLLSEFRMISVRTEKRII